MATSSASTVQEYLAQLPPERREAISTVRDVILQHLPAGYEEGMQYGMIGYYVPLERFPDTYNGQPLGLVALASQKNHMSLYLNSVYGDPETEAWFTERYAVTGKRLDMGKSCLRFRRVEDLPLALIGETIARADLNAFLEHYRAARGSSRATRSRATRSPAGRHTGAAAGE